MSVTKKMTARSSKMTSGMEKAPHRSLLSALGMTREEMRRPLIGIANAANEIIPGHIHLDKIVQAVKDGVRMAGGTPMEFPTIGVCDGLAMNHEGMHFSLPSRELIADSVEIMATAHPFDALVLVPNCDKVVPGMLMAALRLNIPTIVVSGGPMLAGEVRGNAWTSSPCSRPWARSNWARWTSPSCRSWKKAPAPAAAPAPACSRPTP
jgi:Dihydroxyacid dehydratase/phosphogluconate dehydratase